MYRGNRVAVVIPAFNESNLIGPTLESVPDYIDWAIVVDDGSTDDTSAKVSERGDSRIVCIRHETNRGVGAAILTGYITGQSLGADCVAVMAGDNQMDPACLNRLLDPLIDGLTDYSKGNRLYAQNSIKGMSKWRHLGNTMLSIMTKVASGYYTISDSQNGYTCINGRALRVICQERFFPYYGYCNDILIKLNAYGFRVVDVSIPARYGSEKSKIRYCRYMVRVSFMLLRGFIWRFSRKHFLLGRKKKIQQNTVDDWHHP